MISQNPSMMMPEPYGQQGQGESHGLFQSHTHGHANGHGGGVGQGYEGSPNEALDALLGNGSGQDDISGPKEGGLVDRKGKGKEATDVRAEGTGVHGNGLSNVVGAGSLNGNGNGADGPGSARTRVSMSRG